MPRASAGVEVEVEGRRLLLRNLDKVFYPATGFTKGDMVDYYRRVAPALLPHLRDRPLTLKRYPEGVDGPFFYEKRCPAHRPRWVHTEAIWMHVVFDPQEARLIPGEILVCAGTDPAWTPLFMAARGLVTEVGGMMTHGSVVAREYGIPAVVGVAQATTRLKTGQRVRVNGSNGQVVILE